MKLTPKKISFSNNIIRRCQVAPVVGIFWNPVGSPPLTQVEYTLSVLEKSTQSLWEKWVAWPRCISRQYVGKVGEKAWKMPWEISGSPLGSLRLGWWTRWDFIGQGVILSLDGGAEARDDWVPKKSKGKRWLGPIIAAFSFFKVMSVGLEKHMCDVSQLNDTCVMCPNSMAGG